MHPILPLSLGLLLLTAIFDEQQQEQYGAGEDPREALWKYVAQRNDIPPAWIRDAGDHYEVGFQGGCVVGTINPRLPRSWNNKQVWPNIQHGIAPSPIPAGAWQPPRGVVG